ncbi:MAG: sialate O-acetylesterase, partial [Sediminibacterium sp.]
VRVPTGAYGGPYTLTVTSGKEKLVYKNILVGEIWLCSGQSNMEMPLEGWRNPDGSYRYPVNHSEHEISGANYPDIRLLQLQRKSSQKTEDEVSLVGGGWRPCSPESVRTFPAAAYFFAREVYQRTKVPIGLIASSVGGSIIEAWTSLDSLVKINEFKEMIDKNQSDAVTNKQSVGGYLFNGMIAPLIPYGIKGALWYQGEFSVSRAYQYKQLLPMMIRDWRSRWGQGDFPFYFVQLPVNHGSDSIDMASYWAELREAQLQTLSVPNTAMAVTIDFIDNDLHPSNKQDIGLRLAWIALNRNHGMNIPYSGPLYQHYRVEGNKMRIFFSNPEVGLRGRNSNTVTGFYISGDDKKFYRARVVIDGETIVVESPKVANPVSVRYKWGDNPIGNLFSKWLLPASPFRTDNWDMLTMPKKVKKE